MAHCSTGQLKECIDTTKTRRKKVRAVYQTPGASTCFHRDSCLILACHHGRTVSRDPERMFELLVQTPSY